MKTYFKVLYLLYFSSELINGYDNTKIDLFSLQETNEFFVHKIENAISNIKKKSEKEKDYFNK